MPYIAKAILGPASNNPAIHLCCDAYLAMFQACLAAGDGNVFSVLDAEKAYRAAMPPLSGHQNICDFIACTAHGISIGAINSTQANQFFAAAKTAQVLLHNQPAAPDSPSSASPEKPKKKGNKFVKTSLNREI
jgi:hypothetical protein